MKIAQTPKERGVKFAWCRFHSIDPAKNLLIRNGEPALKLVQARRPSAIPVAHPQIGRARDPSRECRDASSGTAAAGGADPGLRSIGAFRCSPRISNAKNPDGPGEVYIVGALFFVMVMAGLCPFVMAGLVPAISSGDRSCSTNRVHRDKPGDDSAMDAARSLNPLHSRLCGHPSSTRCSRH